MRANELEQIIQSVKDLVPANLLFTGGEPTFHIEIINSIIAAHPDQENLSVTITSNGWYARLPSKMSLLLKSFLKLDALQLSYDKWHKPALEKTHVAKLSEYCTSERINFSVQAVYSSALDLIEIQDLQEGLNFSLTIQPVESVGRAKINDIAADAQTFDISRLDELCPNKGMLTFTPDLGFSGCCSSLLFNGEGKRFSHSTATEHLSSSFYQEITSLTLRQQMASRGISDDDLLEAKNVRSICSACEFIHCGKRKLYKSCGSMTDV